MLRELNKDMVSQPEQSVTRRVFVDDRQYFDLYVWYRNDTGELFGFQLCYGGYFRAITWMKDAGFLHENITMPKDAFGRWKGVGILELDGFLDHKKVAEEFKAASARIDPTVADLVYQVLSEPENYGKKNPS